MAELTFALIGPLDIRSCGEPIPVPAARQRNLLAALLLRANQPVAKQRLCEAIWGTATPDAAETTLRSYVMRLRRVLGPGIAARLSAQPPGYQFRLERDDEFDLLRLQGCIGRGKRASQEAEWDRAMREFRAGLALWRGEPLCDVPSDYLHLTFVPVATELRTQLWEGLCGAARELGIAVEFIVPLQRLTEEYPLSERLSCLLMSLLVSCNRRIDALAEYRRLRSALISEHGVEPGAYVRELHQELLRETTVPRAPRPRGPQLAVRSGAMVIPRQLPRGASVFAGRFSEIEGLVRYLTCAGDSGLPPVAAISGFPGIGKSELAVAAAHRVARHYPDGQLYADLKGSTDDPAIPGEIAALFIRALGVTRVSIPRDAGERFAQLRSMLADRRMLLLLDDARDADQVRPLIPGSRSCGTLVTGRRGLGGLSEGRQTTLTEMTAADARELLGATIGSDRAAREPAAVAAIIAACGAIPVALYVAGVRLSSRPAWPLSHFAQLLAAENRVLNELRCDNLSVRAVLQSAYDNLARVDPSAGRTFRLLGRRQSAFTTVAEAAELFGQPNFAAAGALEALADSNWLTSGTPGSYALPVLAHAFAMELAAQDGCADNS
jgi:DNA-binding SARP family transcriptional activator